MNEEYALFGKNRKEREMLQPKRAELARASKRLFSKSIYRTSPRRRQQTLSRFDLSIRIPSASPNTLSITQQRLGEAVGQVLYPSGKHEHRHATKRIGES
jgi:hypothetical protein